MTDHLRASPPQRYQEISQHLLAQARQELDQGDILQASEKVWGATAHAIKSVAQQRGWNHRWHNDLRDTANYIGFEYDRPDLRDMFRSLEGLHVNFYEHQLEASDVQDAIRGAEAFILAFTALRQEEPPGSQDHLSTPERTDQERRLRRLTTKTRNSHGDAFREDELANLPPVRPAPAE